MDITYPRPHLVFCWVCHDWHGKGEIWMEHNEGAGVRYRSSSADFEEEEVHTGKKGSR